MSRFVIGYLFLAGALWAQDPFGSPSRNMESLADGPVRVKERADSLKRKEQRQQADDYNSGLAKRFVDLNEALREFQKAYVGANGEVWPQKEVEQIKKAWRSLKKFDPRFDEDKH